MEKALSLLAGKLNAFDEASLSALYERYAERVAAFEPTKRWEEAVLVLGMIQAVRFKNSLFNHHWAQGRAPMQSGAKPKLPKAQAPSLAAAPPKGKGEARRGKVLPFGAGVRDDDSPAGE